jgi:hypothetical protein
VEITTSSSWSMLSSLPASPTLSHCRYAKPTEVGTEYGLSRRRRSSTSEVVGRWASQAPSQLAGRDGGSRRRQSSPTRYGRCSPVCAGDERAEHRQGKTGAFDRLNSKLDAHAKKFGFDEMTCVWREAVDGMVDGAPTEIKWQYADNARRLESHPVPHQ